MHPSHLWLRTASPSTHTGDRCSWTTAAQAGWKPCSGHNWNKQPGLRKSPQLQAFGSLAAPAGWKGSLQQMQVVESSQEQLHDPFSGVGSRLPPGGTCRWHDSWAGFPSPQWEHCRQPMPRSGLLEAKDPRCRAWTAGTTDSKHKVSAASFLKSLLLI